MAEDSAAVVHRHTELQFVGEEKDGPEAIEKARDLKLDLILLDISLVQMNGIETAKSIRKVAPSTAILFRSTNSDIAIVLAALSTGAQGYGLKTDAATELWPGIEAVLKSKQYVSCGRSSWGSSDVSQVALN